MAFVASALTTEPRKFSLGPLNIEIQSFSMVSTDVTGTASAKYMSRIDDVWVITTGSACQTAAPSISGLTATFTFADPAAACAGYAAKNINGYIVFLGR
ncbi:MAG: hypothetical protein NVS1B10_06770 [Candidatus Saccharimonadales bacterium]